MPSCSSTKQVLGVELGDFNAVRAKRSKRLPTVLSRQEVQAVIEQIPPPIQLLVQVMYGGGLRLGEACSLRVKDVDLTRLQITVRQGQGDDKDRVALLSERLVEPLRKVLDDRRNAPRAGFGSRRGVGGTAPCVFPKITEGGVVAALAVRVRRVGSKPPPSHRPARTVAHPWNHRAKEQSRGLSQVCRADQARNQPRLSAQLSRHTICWRTATTSAPSKHSLGHSSCRDHNDLYACH